MSRATNDMDLVRMLIGPAVMYTANTIFSLPLTLVWMIALDWKLTLFAIIPMLGLPSLTKYFGKQTYRFSKEQQDSFGDLTTMVQENLAGVRVVKAYRQELAEEEKFLERNDDYIDKSLSLAAIQATFFPSIRLLIGLGYLILLVYGGTQIIQGDMQVGTLVSFLILFGMLVWPLIAAGWVINLIQRGLASLLRIKKIFDAEAEIKDPEKPVTVGKNEKLDIQFKDLTFCYGGTSVPQLKKIDVEMPAGKSLGIVGPVGSGKTTLVNLLARYYPVNRDQLLIAGHDINDWKTSDLRDRIAFVFQETFLFSDTIKWNIRFGTDDDTTLERIEAAAKVANVHEDIIEFPRKYETLLGERGVNLSGGQKQRVAIARALLREADILIFDDALSAVDTHTEEAILRELKEVMQEKTTFLISHRISTVAQCDEIIVLRDGEIVERGSHTELVQLNGLYADINRKQLDEQYIEEYDDEPVEGEVH